MRGCSTAVVVGLLFFITLKNRIMKTEWRSDLVRLAKENGWRVSKKGDRIVLSKGRSVIECPDSEKTVEYLQTNNI